MYEIGREQFNNKEYEAARITHRANCDGGSAKSCNSLGYMLDNGFGGSKDKAGARSLFEKACELNHGMACVNITKVAGDSLTDAEKYAYFDKACTAGSGEGCWRVGFAHSRGTGVPQDKAKAMPYYRMSCGLGDAQGCYNMAFFVQRGIAQTKDTDLAMRLHRENCEKRNFSDSCLDYGELYYSRTMSREGVEWAEQRAMLQHIIPLQKKACEKGSRKGCQRVETSFANLLLFNPDKHTPSDLPWLREYLKYHRLGNCDNKPCANLSGNRYVPDEQRERLLQARIAILELVEDYDPCGAIRQYSFGMGQTGVDAATSRFNRIVDCRNSLYETSFDKMANILNRYELGGPSETGMNYSSRLTPMIKAALARLEAMSRDGQEGVQRHLEDMKRFYAPQGISISPRP